MHKKLILSLAAVSTLALGGCVGGEGRPQIMSSDGVNSWVKDRAARSEHSRGTLKLFVDTAELAYPASPTANTDPAIQRLFMRRGFALVKDRCRTYFSIKSSRQRTVNVWQEVFAPVTVVATGVLALVDGGETVDSDYLRALGLGIGAAEAGFKIYEEQFLFSADNVDAVRVLVENALRVDANQKLATAGSQLNYTASVEAIVGNQLICSPQQIIPLVKKAIENGRVISTNNASEVETLEVRKEVTKNPDSAPIPETGITVAPA